MKKYKKIKTFLCFFCLFFLMISTGCQKNTNMVTSDDNTSNFSIETLTFDQKPDQITAICCTKKQVYLIGKYNDKEGNWLVSLDLNGNYQELEQISDLNDNISALASDSDGKGNFRMLAENFQMDKGTYQLILMDYKKGTGSIIKREPIALKIDYKPSFAIDMTYTALTMDRQNIIVYSNAYKEGKKLSCAYMDTLSLSNGTIVTVVSGEKKMEQWDIKTGKKLKTFPIKFFDNSIHRLFLSEDKNYQYYFENEEGIYGGKKEGICELLFSWTEAGIIETYLRCIDGNNHVFFAVNENNELYRIAEVEKKPEKEDTDEKEIIMATLKRDDDTQRWINEFNESQQKYHIKLLSYDKYENPEERLKLDIISGKAPDIIEIIDERGFPYLLDELDKKGVLEDFYPYIDKDKEISRKDFMQNPLKLLETDGKLTKISPDFTISCMVGNKKIIGERLTWSWQEYADCCSKQSTEDIFANFHGGGCTGIWFNSFQNSWKQYFDFSTGKTYFQDGNFQKQLEIDQSIAKTADGTKQGKYFLDEMYIGEGGISSCFWRFSDSMDQFGKNNIQLIGYPADSGNGVGIIFKRQYAILSTSNKKEGAWQFLRTLWGEEKQIIEAGSGIVWGIPITKDGYDYCKERAMSTKSPSEDCINEKGYYIYASMDKGYALTKEQLAMVDQIIELADTKTLGWSHPIHKIIREEMGLFQLNKTVKKEYTIPEIADILQSKINLYLNE